MGHVAVFYLLGGAWFAHGPCHPPTTCLCAAKH
jgi:hypothetical protein